MADDAPLPPELLPRPSLRETRVLVEQVKNGWLVETDWPCGKHHVFTDREALIEFLAGAVGG